MIGAERNRLGQSHNTWVSRKISILVRVLKLHLAGVTTETAARTAANATLAEQSLRRQTVPGNGAMIGATIGATRLARLPELGQLDRRKLASRAGLAPQAGASGTHRGRRLLWGGSTNLTRARTLAGFTASRHDPIFKAWRQKLQTAAPPKVARIACARKRRTILAAMLRDKTDFRDKKAV